MEQLALVNLSRSYGSFAVTKVCLTLKRGQILCLLGPSGCGKTTLLRLVAGLEKPDSGAVFLESRDVTDRPPHKRQFGMMFQELALFPHKSVFENVAFGLRMLRQFPAQILERTEEMLTLVGLSNMAQRSVGDLSGGEQQRVALARSLAPRPKLLMLDEPLGALDRSLREHLLQEIRSILKKLDVTAIFVTHDQSEALTMGDVVGVMDQGRLVQVDSPQDLYLKPKHPFVARFLGFQNLFSGVALPGGGVDTEIGKLDISDNDLKSHERVTVVIRPEIARQHVGGPEMFRYHKIVGTVQQRIFSGQQYRVKMVVDKEKVLAFDLPNTEPPPGIGDEMALWIDVEEIILIREGQTP
jgi:ABC-type Fe3+/spermidine/putrescine transport system ATPase subunit